MVPEDGAAGGRRPRAEPPCSTGRGAPARGCLRLRWPKQGLGRGPLKQELQCWKLLERQMEKQISPFLVFCMKLPPYTQGGRWSPEQAQRFFFFFFF